MTWTDLKQNWADGDDFTAAAQNAVASAINAIVDGAVVANVATSETTSSTTYADLTTTTDSVTATIGSSGKALVQISTQMNYGSGTNPLGWMAFAMSGANTQSASDQWSCAQGFTGTNNTSMGNTFLLSGLTPGSTTFKLKYRVGAGSVSYLNRRISVIPFP